MDFLTADTRSFWLRSGSVISAIALATAVLGPRLPSFYLTILLASLLFVWVLEQLRRARRRASEAELARENADKRIAEAETTLRDCKAAQAAVIEEEATRKKNVAEALVYTQETAEKTDRANTLFLADMSHEILTPMNAILGFTQVMLHDPALTPQQKQHLKIINRSGEHLLALITDTLEHSKTGATRSASKAPQLPHARRVQHLRPECVPCRVLIADDNEDNRALLNQMLDRVGFELCEAVDGAEALDQFEMWRPDLILMDMRMPVLDGYEAVRLIRAAVGGTDVKVILLTGSASEENSRGAISAGADGFLGKPFREQELFESIGNLLGVEYVYGDDVAGAPPLEDKLGESLSPGSLLGLPDALLTKMRDAVVAADFYRVLELISLIDSPDASVARGLRQLAECFDSNRLLQLLQVPKKGNL